MTKEEYLQSLSRDPSSNYGQDLSSQYRPQALDARREYFNSLINSGIPKESANKIVGKHVGNPMMAIPVYQEVQKIPAQEQINLYNQEFQRKQNLPAQMYVPQEQDRSWDVQQFLETLKNNQRVV
jgi:hypothetical protein